MRRLPTGPMPWLLLLVALGCGGEPAEPELLRQLPVPNEGDVTETARAQFAEARSRVAEAARAGEGPALAEAIGALGSLYLVHEYPEPALECFRRAGEADPAEARWPYLTGYLQQRGGNLDEAATAFEGALELRPESPAALYRLGEVELDRDRPAAAAERFRRALEIDDGFSAAHFGLGRAALAQRQYDLAITHLRAALAAQPEATKIHHALGLAYRGSGEMERAQNHLSRRGDGDISLNDPWIAEIDELAASGSGHLRSGLEAGRQGDRQRAQREFRAAIENDPTDLIARHNLAVSLARDGDTAGAEEQYREILRREPANSQAAFNLGNLMAQQGKLDDAIALFRQSVASDADFKQARMNLAAALGRRGRWQEAVAEYDAVIRLDPEFASVRSLRSLALTQAGRADEGVQELRDLLRDNPGDLEARITLISVQLRRGDRPAADEEIAAALAAATSPADRAHVQLESAKLLAMTGDLEAAVSRLRAARQLDPGLTEAALALGQLLLRADRPAEAAVELRQVVEQQPQSVTPRLAEVHALWRSGDCGAARQRLEAAIEVMPRSAELAHALARLLATCPEDGQRDGERALALAQQLSAAQPTGGHAETLAMALAETGRFAEAAELQARLLADATGHANEQVLQRLRANLERYRRAEPVRLRGLEP